jgi:hypothetical protein
VPLRQDAISHTRIEESPNAIGEGK